ncbi:MAG: hypothetical protein H6718_02015 [Polyangiaceae bacterium]|nr:hypothetical protein [Polyangiaceae bacterium]MCB9608700.1 hypothetical protein [Polyangiaceae bacterium]
MRRTTKFLVAAVAVSLIQVGCRKKEEEQEPQSAYQQQQPYGQQPYGQQPTAQPSATAAPPANPLGAIFSDPNALQGILSGALAGGQATLGAVTGGELGPVQSGIQMNAGTSAKGARADGELMSAKLQQDGHAQATFTLMPGKCYTFIGFGGLGVFEFQINITTAPPLPPQVLAQSAPGAGNQPVVGPNEQCLRSPSPIAMPVTVDMHVVKGQGMVGAQAYSK